MSHIDDDDLSVIALGESTNAQDEAHLRDCARCRSRLDQFAAVVAASRSIALEDRPVSPPDSVWAGISAELGLGVAEASAEVVPLDEARRRRSPRWLMPAAAAVVGLLAGSVLTAGIVSGGSGSADLIASADLAPVSDAQVTGTAVVERSGETAVLRVSVPDLPSVPDGYYEVWMATADADTMVALGTLSPGSETVLPLPVGMQVADFPLVDVSVEHFDGDPGHSAVSVVRGLLPA